MRQPPVRGRRQIGTGSVPPISQSGACSVWLWRPPPQRPRIELCVPFSGTRLPTPRGAGAEWGPSSSLDSLLTVPRPLRGESLGTRCSRTTGAFHSLRQIHGGSVPHFPAHRRGSGGATSPPIGGNPLRRCRLRFTLPTGHLLHVASTSASQPKPEASLRRTPASPRTDSHRPTVESLYSSRHVRSFAFMVSELQDVGESRLWEQLDFRHIAQGLPLSGSI